MTEAAKRRHTYPSRCHPHELIMPVARPFIHFERQFVLTVRTTPQQHEHKSMSAIARSGDRHDDPAFGPTVMHRAG